MIGPRWRKVLGDLWGNKIRTALVVLSIAVGVFAVGMVSGTQVILTRDMQASYRAINPPAAIIGTDLFDDALVQTIRRMPAIDEAEGRSSITVRVRVGPDQWRTLALEAIPDFDDMRTNIIWHQEGAWPPHDREVLIERSSLYLTNAAIGDRLTVELSDGTRRSMRLAGTAHNVNMAPAAFTGQVSGFVTFKTLEWLGGPSDFNSLYVTTNDKTISRDEVSRIIGDVRSKIEQSGRQVYFTYVPTPDKHPADSAVQPMLVILGVLGTLSLLLSGFLVVNIVGALLTQQVRQIGVMKAVGARTGQIVGMYLATVVGYGLLALLIAVPLGALGAFGFTSYMANLINFDVVSYQTPPQVLALEIVAGLVVPVAAALWPIFSGARLTVREAINSYGLGKGRFGRSRIDRVLERVRFMSRPMLLSLRNTFRRKGRLLLTLGTLTLGGAIFIGVFSVREALLMTAERQIFSFWRHDMLLFFDRAYRVDLLTKEALSVPGVTRVEPMAFASMRRLRPNGDESDTIAVIGSRPGNDLVNPTLVEGRWIIPGDENALVVSTDVLQNEKDIKVGDVLTLTYDERELQWKVVGIVQGQMAGPRTFANYDYLQTITRAPGRAGWVQVVTDRHDAASRQEMIRRLSDHFKSVGIGISSTETLDEVRTIVANQFSVIVVFLLIMAVLLAVVGGLGLMGTMSINVLERTREIGVLRAIGASTPSILRIVVVEGVLIGTLSWMLGGLLAIPLSLVMDASVGIAFLQTPLTYVFSLRGLLIWLAVVIVLSALASVVPAWNASRLTVRDVLAYDG